MVVEQLHPGQELGIGHAIAITGSTSDATCATFRRRQQDGSGKKVKGTWSFMGKISSFDASDRELLYTTLNNAPPLSPRLILPKDGTIYQPF